MNLTGLFRNNELRKKLEESRGRLYRTAYAWSCDPSVADDLAQEAIMRALGNIHQLRDPERLISWLYAILHNCWREHLRRQRPDVALNEDDYVCENCPEKEHGSQEIAAMVRQAIAKLPIGQRKVITLVDLEGFSYAEVAEIVEVPIGTVMSRLHRARKALQQALFALQPEQVAGERNLRRVK